VTGAPIRVRFPEIVVSSPRSYADLFVAKVNTSDCARTNAENDSTMIVVKRRHRNILASFIWNSSASLPTSSIGLAHDKRFLEIYSITKRLAELVAESL
jgi:hypothetical protein